eukprot:TRINITY_DN1345_c3_g1_i3.p1 TRINITY_DN1345_c3_g1~~TRINITY_DN1345_c3_g1_i3.p1  ORF type:complete len:637 (+),score=216.01 TRINITY_DN1345_c3_g1_i3:115-2025(+)
MAEKMDLVLNQHLSLLSPALRDSTSLEHVSPVGNTGSKDGDAAGGGSRSRRRVSRTGSNQTLMSQVFIQRVKMEEEQRKLKAVADSKLRAEKDAQMDAWWTGVLGDRLQRVGTVWQIPHVGHFLSLMYAELGLRSFNFQDFELGLAAPRYSSSLAQVMNVLLDVEPSDAVPPSYQDWAPALKKELERWYSAYEIYNNDDSDSEEEEDDDDDGDGDEEKEKGPGEEGTGQATGEDAHGTLDTATGEEGEEEDEREEEVMTTEEAVALVENLMEWTSTFDVLGPENPLLHKEAKDLSVEEMGVILLSLCYLAVEATDEIRTGLKDLKPRQTRVLPLGKDAEGRVYWHFPAFEQHQCRLYREEGPVEYRRILKARKEARAAINDKINQRLQAEREEEQARADQAKKEQQKEEEEKNKARNKVKDEKEGQSAQDDDADDNTASQGQDDDDDEPAKKKARTGGRRSARQAQAKEESASEAEASQEDYHQTPRRSGRSRSQVVPLNVGKDGDKDGHKNTDASTPSKAGSKRKRDADTSTSGNPGDKDSGKKSTPSSPEEVIAGDTGFSIVCDTWEDLQALLAEMQESRKKKDKEFTPLLQALHDRLEPFAPAYSRSRSRAIQRAFADYARIVSDEAEGEEGQ